MEDGDKEAKEDAAGEAQGEARDEETAKAAPNGAAAAGAEAPPDDPQEANEETAKAAPNGAAAAGAKAPPGDGADPLDHVVRLMQEQHFGRAAAMLQRMLKKTPDDSVLLHNLGVVLTEQSKWVEAEDAFMKAFEEQKKAGKLNYATLYGLGTVLTEQGGSGKLLQAEALFRDCLVKAIEQEENGVVETYRAFTSLAENLGLQKRWKEAAEAYEQSLALGTRMFGEGHDCNVAQSALLERARRLARLQKYMRIALWAGTAAVPVICVGMWKYVGGPSVGEMLQFTGFFGESAAGQPAAEAAASHGAEL